LHILFSNVRQWPHKNYRPPAMLDLEQELSSDGMTELELHTKRATLKGNRPFMNKILGCVVKDLLSNYVSKEHP